MGCDSCLDPGELPKAQKMRKKDGEPTAGELTISTAPPQAHFLKAFPCPSGSESWGSNNGGHFSNAIATVMEEMLETDGCVSMRPLMERVNAIMVARPDHPKAPQW